MATFDVPQVPFHSCSNVISCYASDPVKRIKIIRPNMPDIVSIYRGNCNFRRSLSLSLSVCSPLSVDPRSAGNRDDVDLKLVKKIVRGGFSFSRRVGTMRRKVKYRIKNMESGRLRSPFRCLRFRSYRKIFIDLETNIGLRFRSSCNLIEANREGKVSG